MGQTSEPKPATVGRKGISPAFPKQAGEARDPKPWAERCVWTERGLERLAQSQEQTVWYSLWDKIWSQSNLDQAVFKVILNQGGAGVNSLGAGRRFRAASNQDADGQRSS